MNRKFKPNRQGITLLFVISMIVLFLLMGTAFVVVSNTFNRESTNRSRSNQPEGRGPTQGNQVVEEAIYQALRGTPLTNVDSPLRTNDILADQYGYGVRAFVSRSTAVRPAFIGGQAFIQLALDSDPDANPADAPDNMCFDLLTLSPTPQPLSPAGLSGTFGGRVLSFVSGPAKGYSARIMADAFTDTGTLRFRIPTALSNGDTVTSLIDIEGSEVIINGRDFSGVGAAAIFTNGQPTSLGAEAAMPNRIGESHADLLAYLNSSNSVNEPWDAADVATPFLSGFDSSGDLLPSFHSQDSFRAFDADADGLPDVDTDGDGVNDAYWMDLGMAVVTNAQGQRFRPLVAIHIRDMDGLLNVNAHGNRTHLQDGADVDLTHAWAGGVAPGTPRGMGMGVPEINLVAALNNDLAALERILDARYGDDNLPGNDSANSPLSRAKLFGHPTLGTVGRLYGTAMDLNGRFRMGTPLTTPGFLDETNATFLNSLPQIDMPLTRNTNEFFGNPYEMSLSGESFGDDPFTVAELEGLLRPNDIDSRILPNRLSSQITMNRQLFTTDSFDVPMLYRSFVLEVDRLLRIRTPELTDDDRASRTNLLNGQLAFAPELFAGLKMDINRPLGDGIDNNSNDVFDEPSETVAENSDAEGVFGNGSAELQMDLSYSAVRDSNGANTDTNPRVIFARNLYMLAMLLLDPVDLDRDRNIDSDDDRLFAQAMAQWAVNVVDFRDPDSIHTRFVYDPEPFDDLGWNPVFDVIDDQGVVTTPALFAVWGCERPELLISETLANHDRRTEDLSADGGTVAVDAAGGPSDANGDFDQRLRPEAFAYFELYNPWVQNNLNQTFPSELYDNQGVQLTRVNDFDAPVWRFEVERIRSNNDPKPLRYVYMVDPTDASITYNDSAENQVPADIEVFYPSTPGNISVSPGAHAVVGTQGYGDEFRTFLGRRKTAVETENIAALELDTTTHLSFDPTAGTVTSFSALTAMSETRNAGIVLIDQAAQLDAMGVMQAAGDRQFSLSDPYEGYPDEVNIDGNFITNGDGFIYRPIRERPLDRLTDLDSNRDDDDIRVIVRTNRTNRDFRTIRLQRLANPLIAWDSITNPYLTIDSLEADLVCYNGVNDATVVLEPGAELRDPGDPGAVSHERAANSRADGQLWQSRRSTTLSLGTPGDNTHNFNVDLVESLGRTNDAYLASTDPFPSLTWNNRPFVSHMEIMNVPYLAPDELTYASLFRDPSFTIDNNTNPFTPPTSGRLLGRYGHLMNFFGADDNTANTNDFPNAYRLLDYLEVPSRFVGNESWYLTDSTTGVLRHPFNTISHYRVPGKININTIPPDAPNSANSLVWNALVSDEYAAAPMLNWGTVRTSLHGSPTGNFENPVRPAEAANLVPGVTVDPPISGSACTLLRPGVNQNAPLFDYESSNASDNTDRSAAFRNGIRTRLGNMVTTKSSVFAGWVTVGFFEVNADDTLLRPLPEEVGIEIGVDSGEQVRHRGFFIFDRSIPVAYEPGKNHNINKAIRVKTIIE